MRRVGGLAAQNGVGIQRRARIPFHSRGRGEMDSDKPSRRVEGFDE